jgi:predicted small lipoprotein YifL
VGRFDRSAVRFAAICALLMGLGLTLSACGRKGPLDPPPASLAGPAQPSTLGTDERGRDIAPPGEKKRLPIDVLLD